MIKINLLPVKRKKKPKPVPPFLIVGVLLLTLSVIALITYSYVLGSKIEDLEVQKAANAEKIAKLNEKLKEVKDFERLNQRYKERQAIIEQLTRNQSIPVRILDEMNRRLTDGVWLSSMSISGEKISLDGVGFSNSDIVAFVQNLKESELFADVVLLETRQTGKEKVELYSFRINLQVKA
ncbi:MAG: PilN domain-containing protein [Thermodesulfovibrionales bacterium]